MTKSQAWISAFRLRTLPLSVSGILFGSFAAFHEGFWNLNVCLLAISTTLLFQIISNLANDLGDSQKGTDNNERVGPTRAVQSGIISQKEMKRMVVLFSILAFISAGFLIYFGTKNLPTSIFIFYCFLALACVLAAISYTVGKKAYGYHGFGDLFVFIFFGLVSVLGVYPLFSNGFNFQLIYPAIAIGFLSTAVLNLNNMRDRLNDKKCGKNTLVVLIGGDMAKLYHVLLIILGLVFMTLYLYNLNKAIYFVALFPGIVLVLHLFKVMKTKHEKEFDPELKKVALSTFAISFIFMLLVIFTA
jgi:1,4-dihydroxy-2-naphthoate octaprenyltransferase